DQSINQSKITKNLSQNEVHSDPDLILYNPSVLIDKEPINHTKKQDNLLVRLSCFSKKTEYFSLKLVA
ncbi:hypothetical protein ACTFYN_05060, partial [Enterococcus faecium]